MQATNWAGNHRYRAARLHRPASLDELREILAAAPRIRVLGTRHSFTDIADSDELVSLDGLPAEVVIDREAATVCVPAAMTYGALAEVLRGEGLALANLASLPHTSVAGAVATATHGSGVANGNLATAVAGIELVTSGGEVVRAARGDGDFDGLVIGLGALGAVTRLTLDVEPAYEVRQRVYEGLSWGALLGGFDAIMAAGYSVSVFTLWGDEAGQAWVKSRVSGGPDVAPLDFFGARPATAERHPIPGLDPVNCTPQLGVPGAWSDRLPHFRLGFTPSAGDELQSEFFVARGDAAAALTALRGVAAAIVPVLQVSELRTVAADAVWMSPHYGRDSLAVHFTWEPRPGAVARALEAVESALAPLGARPHWGKVFLADAGSIVSLYERAGDFSAPGRAAGLPRRLWQRVASARARLTRQPGVLLRPVHYIAVGSASGTKMTTTP
jgi:alditol oxidase